jgi:hypothetical protein
MHKLFLLVLAIDVTIMDSSSWDDNGENAITVGWRIGTSAEGTI